MSCFFPAAIHVYSLATTWSSGLAKKLTLVYCTVLPCGPSQPESRGLKYVCAWGVRTSKCCYNCCITLLTTTREQGWHSGDNSRLPPTLPEFDSGLVSCMGRVCYCQSHLAPRVFFFLGISGFPPSTKTNFAKFQFDQVRGPAWKPATADVASSLNIIRYYILFYQFTRISRLECNS